MKVSHGAATNWIHSWSSIDKAVIAVPMLVGLALRLAAADMPLYGDESWHFFVSSTLGMESVAVAPPDPLIARFLYRPVFYLFFAPWALAGFDAFRIANLLVGLSVIGLTGLLARQLLLSRLSVFVATTLVALHPMQIRFSVFPFHDMLATSVSLIATILTLRRRYLLATVAFAAAVLVKEAFAVCLIPLVVVAYIQERDWHIPALIGLGLAPALVSRVVAIGNGGQVLDALWSNEAFGALDGDLMVYWLYLIPFYLLLIPFGRIKEFVLLAVFPLFYFLWSFTPHGGVANWYSIAPSVFAAVGIGALLDELRIRFGLRMTSRVLLSVAVVSLLMLPLPVGPAYSLFDGLRDPSGAVDPRAVAEAVNDLNPHELLLLNVFWGYAYYPFASTADHVTKWFTEGADPDSVLQRIDRADLIVIPASDTPANNVYLNLLSSCPVSRHGDFILVQPLDSCIKRVAVG